MSTDYKTYEGMKQVRMKDQWQLLWDRIAPIPTYKP